MLTQSPALHILHETGFLDVLRKRSDDYSDLTRASHRWFLIRDLQTNAATSETKSFSAFDLTLEEAESSIRNAAPTDFYGAARALFEAAAQKKDAVRWGDKTPRHVTDISWLATSFPDAQFLHIIRDGRDVARSMCEAGWKPSVRSASQNWKNYVKAGRRAGYNLASGRYREVSYERLVLNPESTLQTLCDWLGLAYAPAMLRFHKQSRRLLPDAHDKLYSNTQNPLDPSRVQSWKDELSPRQVADIEAIAGDLLVDLGYTLTGHRVPLWLRAARAAGAPLLRAAKRALDRAV